jgi:hypothetical protein
MALSTRNCGITWLNKILLLFNPESLTLYFSGKELPHSAIDGQLA